MRNLNSFQVTEHLVKTSEKQFRARDIKCDGQVFACFHSQKGKFKTQKFVMNHERYNLGSISKRVESASSVFVGETLNTTHILCFLLALNPDLSFCFYLLPLRSLEAK